MKQRNKSALQAKTGRFNKIHLYKKCCHPGFFPFICSTTFPGKKACHRAGTATNFFCGGGGGVKQCRFPWS